MNNDDDDLEMASRFAHDAADRLGWNLEHYNQYGLPPLDEAVFILAEAVLALALRNGVHADAGDKPDKTVTHP